MAFIKARASRNGRKLKRELTVTDEKKDNMRTIFRDHKENVAMLAKGKQPEVKPGADGRWYCIAGDRWMWSFPIREAAFTWLSYEYAATGDEDADERSRRSVLSQPRWRVVVTKDNEAAKRREIQMILLREGYTQTEAREMAAELATDKLDEYLNLTRESAARFPERAILPEGTPDLADIKRDREWALEEVEEEKYYARRDRLCDVMAELFSVPELPTATLMALVDALEAGGIARLDAFTEIEKELAFLRKVNGGERS